MSLAITRSNVGLGWPRPVREITNMASLVDMCVGMCGGMCVGMCVACFERWRLWYPNYGHGHLKDGSCESGCKQVM